ncbi:MAG: hypothetical protein EOS11_14670 [Mesorhizobium sp.]|uniref:hypothetical protein n=1 Tax=Mesorhizobium sp. TaxID=1871066 RepID=UPI000FE2F805|nr:hypothetical protein [Mesorhizobium sp.]RWO31478.1 MAG: hypothetical protein EOS10_14005 [Mesorhizobium sp.]RWO42828.1 MAG: hypothetical protein EOS11_14670 [Mesorhizobium sp.]TIN76379.1 MAG: hypothetical protein E5Y09_22580 [Mesorhizobium sp.]
MSADCDKPTLTFRNGSYNATQVRLYGIVQDSYTFTTGDPKTITSADGKIVTKVAIADNGQKAKQVASEVKKLRATGLIEEDIHRRIVESDPDPAEKLSAGPYYSRVVIDLKKTGRYVDILAESLSKNEPISCGIIVGYAYEGHCYDLPKPKIMLIPAIPELIPVDDCGYRDKYVPTAREKYMLWIVDKLDECVEFEMNQGFVEQIVLEANLPGKRSPTMYASRMMMGHRGGRLGE